MYEEKVRRDVAEWERAFLKPPGFLARTSKTVQAKINRVIPENVQQALSAATKGTMKSVLYGVLFVPKGAPQIGLALEERDEKARELLSRYKTIAAVEGAGTGAGGFVLGLMDFPALLAIKMKFLFELAHVYGYHTQDYRERLFFLYVFQLAFSSQEMRPALFRAVRDFERTVQEWPVGESYLKQVNWETFQREYRDAIDFRKLLQLLPGIGAVVGAWANYGLLDDLGVAAIHCFRMRALQER